MKKSVIKRVMTEYIASKQKTREAQQNNTEKAQKNKRARPNTLQQCQRDNIQNASKKIRHQSPVAVFFKTKIPNIFIG